MRPDSDEANQRSEEDLQKQVRQLRQENERLKERSAAQLEGTSSAIRWRRGIATAMVILGVAVLAAATVAVWLNRQVMDTDTYVATVAPLSEDPAIQSAVANFATERLFAEVDAEQLAKNALPDNAQFLAPPIVDSLEGFVRTQATNLLDTPQFSEIWVKANRAAHDRLVGALTGQGGGAIQAEGGTVTLNLGEMLGGVQSRLDNSGIAIFQDVNLDNAQFTLLQSDALAQVQGTIATLNALALWLPILAIGLLGGAIWLSPARRRTVLWIGVGIVVAMAALRLGIDFGRGYFLDASTGAGVPQDAASSFFDIIISSLLTVGRAIFAFGLIVAIGAVLAGPSTYAVRLREALKGGIAGIGGQFDFGAPGRWIEANKRALRIVGVAAALIAVLAVDRVTIGMLGLTVVLLLVYLAAIEFFGQSTAEVHVAKQEGETKRERERPAA